MHLVVKTTSTTNQGNPFYVMTRRFDDALAAPLAETYQDVAVRLFATPPDASVVSREPLIPGRLASFDVETSSAKALTVYFLFTAPVGSWRVPVRAPFPSVLTVDLDEGQIKTVQKQ